MAHMDVRKRVDICITFWSCLPSLIIPPWPPSLPIHFLSRWKNGSGKDKSNKKQARTGRETHGTAD